MRVQEESRLETFFQDPIYLQYKNYLYNYLVRRRAIRRLTGGNHFQSVLELGCGISPMMNPSPSVVQTDLSWQALKLLKRTGSVRPVACDATLLPFQGESFDCVICSEVIEHVGRDDLVLREISRILKKGGRFYLTVPVNQKFFGFDDEFVGHYRRYEVLDLKRLLSQNGLLELQTYPLMGTLEKWIMEKTTHLFSLKKKGETQKTWRERGIRLLACVFFPVYLVLNYGLAFAVGLQARTARSMDEIVDLCLHYRKAG
jgi:ubiquinone/menaquinone biosynthesis C-methylase UbiE